MRELLESGVSGRDRVWAVARGSGILANAWTGEPDYAEERLWALENARVHYLLLGDAPNYVRWAAQQQYLALFAKGDYARAQEVLEEVLPTFDEVSEARAEVLADLATLAYSGGEDQRVLDLLDQAERALPASDEPSRLLAQLYITRCNWYLQQGLPDRASPWIEKARDELLRLPREDAPTSHCAFDLIEVRFTNATGAHDLTVELAESKLRQRQHFEPHSIALYEGIRLWLGTALVWGEAQTGDRSRAFEHLVAVRDSKAAYPVDRAIAANRLAYLESRRGNLEAARDSLSADESQPSTASGDSESRVYRLESGLRRAVECRLARIGNSPQKELTQATAALHESFDALLQAWHRNPAPVGGRGLLELPEPALILSELCSAYIALDSTERGRQRALEVVFRAQSANSLLLEMGVDGGDLAHFQREYLAPSRGALVFVPGPDESHLFALDSERIVHQELPASGVLEQRARDFQNWLAPTGSAEEASLQTLRRRNLASLGKGLSLELFPRRVRDIVEGWDELLWIGEEHLAGLRLGALPWLGDRPLAAEKAVATLFAMPLGNALLAQTPRPAAGLVLIASPEHDRTNKATSDLLELGMSTSEVARLAESTKAEPVSILAHAEATRERLLDEARRGRARGDLLALGFLTHGIFAGERTRPSGLVLSPSDTHDGRFFSEDLEGLPAPPIVFLGCCGAGRGPRRSGDPGIAHLGGAFLRSGACAVVYADADVPFEETKQLLGGFLRQAVGGLAPSEALRVARNELIESGSLLDPESLYLFKVAGLAHLPLSSADTRRAPSTSRWVFWGLALFVLGAWQARRRLSARRNAA